MAVPRAGGQDKITTTNSSLWRSDTLLRAVPSVLAGLDPALPSEAAIVGRLTDTRVISDRRDIDACVKTRTVRWSLHTVAWISSLGKDRGCGTFMPADKISEPILSETWTHTFV